MRRTGRLAARRSRVLAACRPASARRPARRAAAAAPPWRRAAAEPEPRARHGVDPARRAHRRHAARPPPARRRRGDGRRAGRDARLLRRRLPVPGRGRRHPDDQRHAGRGARTSAQPQDKRLCTELELERACKGPANTTYEYGDAYKPAACGTGTARALVAERRATPPARAPSASTTCTAACGRGPSSAVEARRPRSRPRRGARRQRRAPASCSAAAPTAAASAADARREDVGVRCCAGEPNTFEVVLSVTRGEPLRWQPPDDQVAPRSRSLPEDCSSPAPGPRRGRFARRAPVDLAPARQRGAPASPAAAPARASRARPLRRRDRPPRSTPRSRSRGSPPSGGSPSCARPRRRASCSCLAATATAPSAAG